MKMKNLLPGKSPIGWMIAAGVMALACSPAVRKRVRNYTIKGLATMMEVTDRVKDKFTDKVKDLSKPITKETFDFDFSLGGKEEFDFSGGAAAAVQYGRDAEFPSTSAVKEDPEQEETEELQVEMTDSDAKLTFQKPVSSESDQLEDKKDGSSAEKKEGND